jgi:hypothetical protein
VGWIYQGGQPDNKGAQFASSADTGPLKFFVGTGAVALLSIP